MTPAEWKARRIAKQKRPPLPCADESNASARCHGAGEGDCAAMLKEYHACLDRLRSNRAEVRAAKGMIHPPGASR